MTLCGTFSLFNPSRTSSFNLPFSNEQNIYIFMVPGILRPAVNIAYYLNNDRPKRERERKKGNQEQNR
jgi:hypothetical protein